jgi:hypothetical protein
VSGGDIITIKMTMPFVVNLPMFAVAVVTSFGTGLLSAWLTARKAAKIPATRAIRAAGDIKIKRGEVKTSKLTQKFFGFEGTLALRSLKRNRRNFRATVVSLIELVPELLIRLKLKMPEIVTTMVTGLKEGIGRMRDVGKALLGGIWEGIPNMKSWLIGRIKSLGSAVTDAIKSVLGIHSPSAVFRDQIGANMALGLGEGFEETMKKVSRDMEDAVPTDFDVAANINGATRGTLDTDGVAGINLTLRIDNFYNNTTQDLRQLADELSALLADGIRRRGGRPRRELFQLCGLPVWHRVDLFAIFFSMVVLNLLKTSSFSLYVKVGYSICIGYLM